ncbi:MULTISPECIES: hypothetical protein [unclassified Sulfitobacter]|uniref:hypothetical protein n=1 Tax=Sulfitobacter phage pCB2047-C TaxID=754043 RepID=UPI0002C0C7D1|nr:MULTISPECIES: hypothetical protein [unclassified Sulfitobacter]YP_007675324.1 hypothetical protein SUBG_00067 [Sulfitobacter phage pCB2047-C]YP_007675407.1 hypothetical protein SUAG_00015 [Sulfitobacter phage pCB2047-A]YP_009146207.1 hypothetical protein SUFP_033 [Sulfitobacter phage NYA-2014a]AGG91237.1 hypothetical protein SUBG_00067 [Sulfitobacter phage pCB2047-C]AGH30741.1 hypothetical protein SUAG_00015 [Sulfitobacter phage pCB2047-A]AIM40664.1 hypothetical protein SUFP_033 [Sulfitoba
MADAKGRKTGGRKKGTPNKVTALLRDDILQAASNAHPGGRLGYLTEQAQENPTAFMTLLGKVLPTEVKVDADQPIMFASIALAPLVADAADD